VILLSNVSFKVLYISEKEVYPIPIPKKFVYKAIPELANKSVLGVNMIYEIQNRKPWRLINFSFDRILLDENGQYIFTAEESNKKSYNFIEFALVTPEELSRREEPLPIPQTIVIPDAKEKETLIKYIKQKYPLLWDNSPEVLEKSIRSYIAKHNKLKDLVKKASAIKKKSTRSNI
jgi:hypothetical protein